MTLSSRAKLKRKSRPFRNAMKDKISSGALVAMASFSMAEMKISCRTSPSRHCEYLDEVHGFSLAVHHNN